MKDLSFYKELGYNVGGPLFAKLSEFFKQEMKKNPYYKPFYLSKDGINLATINQGLGIMKGELIHVSDRSILLAGVSKLDDKTLNTLPPYTYGQTLWDIFKILEFYPQDRNTIKKVDFLRTTDPIEDKKDIENFRTLYKMNKSEFLNHCAEERINAVNYFKTTNVLENNLLVFSTDFDGKMQYLFEKFLRTIGYDKNIKFVYPLIDNDQAEENLYGKDYSVYYEKEDFEEEDYYNLMVSKCVFDLFFKSPIEQVFKYDDDGDVVSVPMHNKEIHKEILKGIYDYQNDLKEKLIAAPTKEESIKPLTKLISNPTVKEAKKIGDLFIDDILLDRKDKDIRIANINLEDIIEYPSKRVPWAIGLQTREDMPKSVRRVSKINSAVYKKVLKR